jgi:hypothetical protein
VGHTDTVSERQSEVFFFCSFNHLLLLVLLNFFMPRMSNFSNRMEGNGCSTSLPDCGLSDGEKNKAMDDFTEKSSSGVTGVKKRNLNGCTIPVGDRDLLYCPQDAQQIQTLAQSSNDRLGLCISASFCGFVF